MKKNRYLITLFILNVCLTNCDKNALIDNRGSDKINHSKI